MDGLTTLAKIATELRLKEAADRKRKLNEEKRQPRKKKRRVEDKALPVHGRDSERLLAVPGRAVTDPRGKSLSGHTFTASTHGSTGSYV